MEASPDERFSGHRVRLQIFEGPLDLLLYLVRAHKHDICDVSLREVTGQFVEYLALMDEVGLDYAGEFLVTAATLVQIKARALLPPKQSENEDALEADDELDPQEKLVRQLLELQKFQEAATTLAALREERSQQFPRPVREDPSEDEPVTLKLDNISTFDLLRALRRVMTRLEERPAAIIRRREPFTLTERLREIAARLKSGGQTFGALCDDCESRLEVVLTFLAILELVRRGRARAQQLSLFDEIEIALL